MRAKSLLAASLLAGCSSVPITGRHRLMLISEADEIAMGHQAFAEMKAAEPLSGDAEKNAQVRRAGERLARASAQPGYEWEFAVIDKPDVVNAFCLPGGKVAVYTGLLPVAQNEDGLAVVMGHEIAHALARHGAERMSQSKLADVGGAVLSIATGGASPAAAQAYQQAYGVGVGLGVLLPFSRKQESEADHIGLILMAKAGYDPRAAVDFWGRMKQKSGGKQDTLGRYVSTHPSDDKRIEDIKGWLPEALKYSPSSGR